MRSDIGLHSLLPCVKVASQHMLRERVHILGIRGVFAEAESLFLCNARIVDEELNSIGRELREGITEGEDGVEVVDICRKPKPGWLVAPFHGLGDVIFTE